MLQAKVAQTIILTNIFIVAMPLLPAVPVELLETPKNNSIMR